MHVKAINPLHAYLQLTTILSQKILLSAENFVNVHAHSTVITSYLIHFTIHFTSLFLDIHSVTLKIEKFTSENLFF